MDSLEQHFNPTITITATKQYKLVEWMDLYKIPPQIKRKPQLILILGNEKFT